MERILVLEQHIWFVDRMWFIIIESILVCNDDDFVQLFKLIIFLIVWIYYSVGIICYGVAILKFDKYESFSMRESPFENLKFQTRNNSSGIHEFENC